MSHYDVKILFALFECDIGAQNLHHEFTVQHINHIYFPILVFLVLHDSLYRHYLTSLPKPALEHLPEGALPNKTYDVYLVHEQARGC